MEEGLWGERLCGSMMGEETVWKASWRDEGRGSKNNEELIGGGSGEGFDIFHADKVVEDGEDGEAGGGVDL